MAPRGGQTGPSGGILRVGASLRFRETVRGEPLAGREFGQIFLLLFLGAEIDDGQRADSGMRSNADAEGAVGGDFFGEYRGGDAVESRAAVFFRHPASEKPDLSRFPHQPTHDAFFVLFEVSDA